MTTNYVVKWSSLSCNLGPRCGKKMAKNGVKRHKKNRRAKRAERWTGQGEGAAAPFLLLILLLGSLRWSIFFFFTFFSNCRIWSQATLLGQYTGEEKSFRHVAMEAKFLNNNNPRHLKSEFALFQTSSILFNFIQFVKCWRNYPGVNPKGPYVSLKKNCLYLTYAIKRAPEISKFHIAVVQLRLKNVQKSVMHVQSCCFLFKTYCFFAVLVAVAVAVALAPYCCDLDILLPW